MDKKKKKDGHTTHPHPPEAVDQLYAQMDKKRKDGDTTHPHPPKADTPVDQLYAQVDKKERKDGDTTYPHPPEDDTLVDQLYAQVEKKDGDNTHPHPPEADTPADQLYAQVDKKKKSKGKKVCEDPPQQSGAVYSEVMQQTAPSAQVPAIKVDLKLDQTHRFLELCVMSTSHHTCVSG